jgi:hypothetical protein
LVVNQGLFEMKLGIIRRIDKADLAKGGEVPKWADYLLETLNPFIEKVALALQNRLTIDDNLLSKVSDFELTHDVELEINPYPSGGGNLRVRGVVPLTTGEIFLTAFKWTQKSDGSIGVTAQFSGGTTATIRLAIFLG